MATNDKTISELNKELSKLRLQLERVSAVSGIQNLFGHYETIHNIQDMHSSWKLFAQNTPNTWCEVANWGRAEGIEDIKAMWEELQRVEDIHKKEGWMFDHPLSTPVIVVAGDCKTAKATWVSLGTETKPDENGKLTPYWAWGRYAVDFVKEDAWKIWHFKWFRGFITSFHKSWIERTDDGANPEKLGIGTSLQNMKPSKYHNPYSTRNLVKSIPPMPAEYETWTEKDEDWHIKPVDF